MVTYDACLSRIRTILSVLQPSNPPAMMNLRDAFIYSRGGGLLHVREVSITSYSDPSGPGSTTHLL